VTTDQRDRAAQETYGGRQVEEGRHGNAGQVLGEPRWLVVRVLGRDVVYQVVADPTAPAEEPTAEADDPTAEADDPTAVVEDPTAEAGGQI
jgi:hypothetical protein